MKKRLILLCLLLMNQAAHADGGRLRLREPAGPFIVTLFTTPDPLTEGRADFSVAVERSGDQGLNRGLVQDAKVTLVLSPQDRATAASSGDETLVLTASHAAATSAFLQAANFTVPRAGVWKIKILVQQGTDSGECSGVIDVLPYRITTDETAWEIAVVPIAMLLFGVHQARKVRRRRTRERMATG
jgi:hypothetical protein